MVLATFSVFPVLESYITIAFKPGASVIQTNPS
jgi:hypothetical protein